VSIAGEISALQTARLLHLLHSSNCDDEFKSALKECVAISNHLSDCASSACANQLLIVMCAQAHTMIRAGRVGPSVQTISGELPVNIPATRVVHFNISCILSETTHADTKMLPLNGLHAERAHPEI
jgi:hypothetical protein